MGIVDYRHGRYLVFHGFFNGTRTSPSTEKKSDYIYIAITWNSSGEFVTQSLKTLFFELLVEQIILVFVLAAALGDMLINNRLPPAFRRLSLERKRICILLSNFPRTDSKVFF